MKKGLISALLLILVGAVSVSGCSTQESASDNQTPAAPQETRTVQSIPDSFFPATDKSKSPEAAKKRTDTVVATLTEPGGVFNPYFYKNGYDGNVSAAIFAPLVSVDKNGKPIPRLAEKWDISDDQLTYTFHLRPNLKFSDGSPLTAEDVAFTLTILHDKAYDGDEDIFETQIKGGRAYKEGKADTVEGIKVIDPQTIQITTEKVNARSLLILGGPVLSKAYYGKGYKPGNLEYLRTLHGKPLGAGPYKLEKYITGQEVRYLANEHYYAGKPAVEHFIYKTTEGDALQFFQTGETDYNSFTANEDNLELLKSLGYANINVYTSTAYSYIKFNHSKPYFKDKRVRQALIYGLDRQKIVDTAYQGYGQVANVPVSPVSWAYTEEVNPYHYDLEIAKALLDEAGWKVGADGIREKDGQKLKLYYLTTKGPLSDVLIPIAKENYKELGVQLEAELMDYNALLARTAKGDHDLASFSTTMLTDPSDGVIQFGSNRSSSFTGTNGYSNPKVDELLEKGISTLDIEKRKEIYKELYNELSDDPPYIFLTYRKLLTAHNARVSGFDPNGYTGISGNLPDLKIEPIQ
ncbi:ABC transporter substrate-binding protein [Brevibacillus borstelensis AK1]|uniref:ABC transporter substrate-binding protein n=1 Tax=Brevibacillus borstelensis AK1 TaxID=1300222 RepID=M8D4B2_9BACL|nr:ABC transporter substrate-binding protein [Brevibacillus borstelensis]EMT51084.1 ABC transporter substrate-binding protein [Brevibacillus borstelensis AK1]